MMLPKMTDEKYAEFKADIQKNGLTNPTITLFEGKILDGYHRARACEELGIEIKTTEYVGDFPAHFVVSSCNRRDLTDGQKAIFGEEILPYIEKENEKKKSIKHICTYSLTNHEVGDPHHRESAYQAAKIAKSSVASIRFVKKLKEEAPEIHAKVKSGGYTLNDAKRNIKAKAQSIRNAAIIADSSKSPMTPTGKFEVLVIDPPWPLEKIERDCRPNQPSLLDYPTMTVDEIKTLSLTKDFAASDCHVFLWTTQKYLPTSFDILQSWGVKYVCTMVWHKSGGFQVCGLPQYNCEFILYGRIGSPTFSDTKAFNTCFNAPRGKHSEKPIEFYELLNRVTVGRKMDCFNRRKIDGFVGYGNEAKV